MRNNQSGATLFEVIAYISLIGAISVGILSGASALLKESRIQKEVGEIRSAEKEIRTLGITLNNYTPPTGYTTLTSYLCDYERGSTSGSPVLSICKQGSKTDLITSAGRALQLGRPGDFTNDGTYLTYLANQKLPRPFFTIRFNIANQAECLRFAEAEWGRNVQNVCVVSSSTFSCANYRTACADNPSQIALFFK